MALYTPNPILIIKAPILPTKAAVASSPEECQAATGTKMVHGRRVEGGEGHGLRKAG